MRDTLVLSGRELVIEAPDEAFELVRRLYPQAWTGEASRPADLSLVGAGDRWHLRHGGESIGPLAGALAAAFALEHEVESRLVAGRGDRLALHAGGVEAAGRAHLVAGGPDVGKSTSTLLLVELGHRFLCEEVALVEPGTLAVEPHPRTVGLEARHLEEIARERPIEHGAVELLDEREARYAPHRVRLEPAPLGTLFLPRFRAGGGAGAAELDPAEALPEVLGYCFSPTGDEELFFERVIRLLESCRIVRVRFDGVAAARQLWERLLPPAG